MAQCRKQLVVAAVLEGCQDAQDGCSQWGGWRSCGNVGFYRCDELAYHTAGYGCCEGWMGVQMLQYDSKAWFVELRGA